MSALPFSHPPLQVNGRSYDLSHLRAFAAAIPDKGIEGASDLGVVVAFSNHVVTSRATHGQVPHVQDHHGTGRLLDLRRLAMSHALRPIIETFIRTNGLTYVSRSFGGAENLIFLEDADHETWSIVYCLHPIASSAVRMEILSAHPRIVDQKTISRRTLSYFARKCLYSGMRTPN